MDVEEKDLQKNRNGTNIGKGKSRSAMRWTLKESTFT